MSQVSKGLARKYISGEGRGSVMTLRQGRAKGNLKEACGARV